MPKLSREKTLKIFRIINIILFAVYALTITVSIIKKGTAEKFSSIYQNGQKENIRFIEIQEGNSSAINFEKKGTVWTVSDSDINNPTLAIADYNLIDSLIENTLRKSKMIKKAENRSSLVPFELTEEKACRITLRDTKGSVVSDFYLGKTNSHSRQRAFRYKDETSVWEKEFSAETSTDINTWAEHLIYPEIFSEKNTGLTRGKISKLRPAENARPEAIIKKDFLQDSKIILKIYNAYENYLVVPEFIAGAEFDPDSREAFKFLKFNYTISAYTFERLLTEGKNE